MWHLLVLPCHFDLFLFKVWKFRGHSGLYHSSLNDLLFAVGEDEEILGDRQVKQHLTWSSQLIRMGSSSCGFPFCFGNFVFVWCRTDCLSCIDLLVRFSALCLVIQVVTNSISMLCNAGVSVSSNGRSAFYSCESLCSDCLPQVIRSLFPWWLGSEIGHTHVSDLWCGGFSKCWASSDLEETLGHLQQQSVATQRRYLRSFQPFWCNTSQKWNKHPFKVLIPIVLWIIFLFDPTCGYEGEGHQNWTLASLNVGSLDKHSSIFQKQVDVLAIQETRHTAANRKQLQFDAAQQDLALHLGPNMAFRESGIPAWGGVGIASKQGTSRPFTLDDDCSGHFQSFQASARVSASWVTPAQGHTLLVLCVYCFSGAPCDSDRHDANNNLFRQVFEMVAQYGNIPIAICADFQNSPHSYSSINEVIQKGLFSDPLASISEDGIQRPYTFCKHNLWRDSDYKSSIDGILLSNAAATFLERTSVEKVKGLQHAIVILEFVWPSTKKVGAKWHPHAALDLSKIQPMDHRKKIAIELWNKSFGELCEGATNSDELAQFANHFALQILLKSGATWKHGSKDRGTKPTIKLSNVDSSFRSTDGSAKALNLLDKTLRRIDDLSFKIAQCDPTINCKRIIDVCCHRISKVCRSLDFSFVQPPTQENLNEIWKKIFDHREILAKQIRKDRISQWKKRMQGSAAGTMKDVYHYLKFKHREPTVNAMCNGENFPIHHPVDALAFANQQWTQVFDFHKDGIPTQPLLHAIEDAIEPHCVRCTFGPISPQQLFQAVQNRKKSASAGMDGWRTPEFQALPVEAYVPWAMLWNKIENSDWDMPSCFKFARLVILPKPSAKTAQPIHQRLIALLSIPYLAYSRARFCDSIPWQLRVFPSNVCGGVAGRKASDIYHTLAMANESSLVKKQPLVGIKLDRSKCFDKIFVPIIVALGEKLGLDPRFLRTWAKLYIGFERYICWHSFISESPIVGSNGIAQGDTSSVLAINILMSAWAMVVQSFSCIRAAVFVDDAYLYTEAQHVETLAQAVSVTEAFDTMAGQELNLSKSSIWATSNAAKKQLSRLFPNVQNEDFVEVLGGFIKASSVPKVINSPDLFQTIKNFIHDIARLPVDFRAKVRLISSKIVPKITYASEIRPWPRKSIESFTSAITYALWGNRPTWRSAEILFACATDPIRCYPPVAIAASTILNIISRCQQNGEFCQQWIEIQKHKVLKKGLLDLFIISCGVVGLTFEPPCTLRFLDFPSFHFLDLQPAALRKILRVASCQALYQSVLSSQRKDFVKNGSGILDSDSTCLPRRLKQWYNNPFALDESFYLGPLTGATPTANRLYSAGVIAKPNCRFCNAADEDIFHLSQQCKKVEATLGCLKCPINNQPHWDSHGIVEVPEHLAAAYRQVPPDPVIQFGITTPNVTLWTDGSLIGGKHMFSRAMGFSVIDHFGRTVCAQGRRDMWASAFKAELTALLFAVRAAFSYINGTLTVVSDCKSLILVARNIQQSGSIPLNLPHRRLWEEIFGRVGYKEHSRLILRWVRAHQVDNRLVDNASFDQKMNMIADQVAKSHALQAAPVHPSYFNGVQKHLFWRRRWLVQLSKLVGERKIDNGDSPVQTIDPTPPVATDDGHTDIQSRFVRWPWNDNEALYNWSMAAGNIGQPKKWAFSTTWWNTTLDFFRRQRWTRGGDYQMSIYEVAFHFWKDVKMVPPECAKGNPDSFLLIVRWIRMVIRECKKLKVQLWPGSINYEPRKALFLSHTFPYGRFSGGRLFASNAQLAAFGRFIALLPNGGSAATSWDRPVNSIP